MVSEAREVARQRNRIFFEHLGDRSREKQELGNYCSKWRTRPCVPKDILSLPSVPRRAGCAPRRAAGLNRYHQSASSHAVIGAKHVWSQ